LIGETKTVTGKTVTAIASVRAALRPYLLAVEERQRAEAKRKAEEAERLRLEALEAFKARDAANLESAEEAERKLQAAKQAEAEALRAAKAKAHAKGDGRATGLRSVWTAHMTDPHKAAAWVWKERRADLLEFVQGMANAAVRNGARAIEGFEIKETRE
jgi:hypothetical protein